MTDDKLIHDLDALGNALSPEASIVPHVLAVIATIPIDPPAISPRRKWIMRISVGLAACISVVFGLVALLSHPQAAWADVLEKVNQTRSLSFDLDIESQTSLHVYLKGDQMRVEELPNQVIIWNRATGKMLQLNDKLKHATLMNTAAQPFDFYAMLKGFKDGKEEPLGEQVLDGRKVDVFKITRKMPEATGAARDTVLTLWINRSTSMPVQVRTTSATDEGTFKHLKFDGDLPDSLFATTVPADYKVDDLGGITSDQLKAPATAESQPELTLHPGVGIGSLKFGDSNEKVIAALGQPEQTRKGFDLGYPSKGLFVLVHPKGGLLTIMATSKKAARIFAVNDFPAKLDKNIGMESSRADIEAAYGKPSKVTDANGMSVLEYTDLHLTLTLVDDHLVQIFMLKN